MTIKRTFEVENGVERSFLTDYILSRPSLDFHGWPKLTDAYRYIIDHSKSNNLPYHNLMHVKCMVINCYNAATIENIEDKETYCLLLAVLFHDFNHSGGKNKDSKNIIDALTGLVNFLNPNNKQHDELYDIVGSIIQITEYPSIKEPSTILEKIIHDCDRLQMFEDEWFEHCIVGLQKEMSISYGRELSIEEMLTGQINFISSCHYYTKYATSRFKEEWPIIKDLALQKIENLRC